jgi:hypothetical protein
LELWAGATPREPPTERANFYLFSALGKIKRAEVGTAGRTWIVLWASAAALVAGLLLIYVPASRHPTTLLVLGVGMLAVGATWPEPTLLLAQAASLGLALTLVTRLLDRGVARRRWFAAHGRLPVSAVELSSTHAPYRPPSVGHPSPTESLPPAEEIKP